MSAPHARVAYGEMARMLLSVQRTMEDEMKKVLCALTCALSAAACGGESRPAADPSTSTITTSVTTETSNPAVQAPARNDDSARLSRGGSDTVRADQTERSSVPSAPSLTGTGANTSGTASTSSAPASAAGSVAPSRDNPGVADGTKDATNTKINDRDRHGAVTPIDQGGGADRDITAAIRRAVVADGALSFTAKNVKIITTGGKVTLRGPVNSEQEKRSIEAKAKATTGVGEVDNQLEVKK